MMTRVWVGLMLALTLFYVFTLLSRGLILLAEPNPLAVAMGVGIIIFPLFAFWALYAEIRFGLSSQKLQKRVVAMNIPGLDLELRASGRATKESAEAELLRVQGLAEGSEDFAAWFLLAEAYEAAGDRKRARSAMRKAILLAKNANSSEN
ncbi:MAG: tetratricopeptide repeat protein [Aquiluna sp.]|nr:tetratricopeptide repeat protein [Aquiluna sp.]